MHVGKFYPVSYPMHIPVPEKPGLYIPRKLALSFNPLGTIGTVANLWAGTRTISDVGDYWEDDTLWIVWHFENDSDSAATFLVRCMLTEILPHPGIGVVYDWRYWFEPSYDGSRLADRERQATFDQMSDTVGSANQVGPSWLHKTDVPKWDEARCWVTAATWDDQPEYHPYRHE